MNYTGLVIKYENVKDENFSIPVFRNEKRREILVIHQFVNDEKKDYIVIGRFDAEKLKFSIERVKSWLNIIRSLVTNYKSNCKYRKDDYDILLYKLSCAELTQNFEFTQEGYDLITNKFMFTDNVIERTIHIDNYDHNNELVFDNKYEYLVNKDSAFNNLTYYENNYLFTEKEKARLTLDQILEYTKYNYEKMKKVLANSETSWHKDVYKQFQEQGLTIEDFFAQMIDIKIDSCNKCSKQR